MQNGFAVAAATALLIAFPAAGFAQSAPIHAVPRAAPIASATAADKAFLTDAVQGDAAEVKVGELAEKNGGSSAAKSFGKTLVIDHTKAGDQAKATAREIGITAPAQPSSAAQTEYDKLAKLKGAAFDKAFAAAMVEDHQKDIANFQKEAAAKSGPVSAMAQQQLPALKKHLQLAQQLQRTQQASAP
jgi:putative membrane protein